MPHPDYGYKVTILIACSNQAEGATQGNGPLGKFVARSQTHLRHAISDVNAWENRMRGPEVGFDDILDKRISIHEAATTQVHDAITEAIDVLDFYF